MGGDIMKIKWLEHYTIEIEKDFDLFPIEFPKDKIDDIEIIEDRKNEVDIQFLDTSIGYSIPKKWFEKVN